MSDNYDESSSTNSDLSLLSRDEEASRAKINARHEDPCQMAIKKKKEEVKKDPNQSKKKLVFRERRPVVSIDTKIRPGSSQKTRKKKDDDCGKCNSYYDNNSGSSSRRGNSQKMQEFK